MEDLLISTLESLNYPVYLQGTFRGNEQHFFTFWNDDTSTQDYYGNEEKTILWEYSINFYSTDPAKVNSVLKLAKTKLKEKGFVVDGAGYDIPTDEPEITGRGIDVTILQKL